jgi:type II secretion system protein G
MKTTRGFTLIELLVVIAIIGILMALLFPAVTGALNAAKKAQAKNDVTQIATAVVAFETEYGRMPPTGTTVGGDLLKALSGDVTSNPRKIVFIETNAWKKGKGGVEGGSWRDPWGNPIYIAMDDDYDNRISVSADGSSSGGTTITKKVGVWNGTNNTRLQVRSWE